MACFSPSMPFSTGPYIHHDARWLEQSIPDSHSACYQNIVQNLWNVSLGEGLRGKLFHVSQGNDHTEGFASPGTAAVLCHFSDAYLLGECPEITLAARSLVTCPWLSKMSDDATSCPLVAMLSQGGKVEPHGTQCSLCETSSLLEKAAMSLQLQPCHCSCGLSGFASSFLTLLLSSLPGTTGRRLTSEEERAQVRLSALTDWVFCH